MSSVSIKGDPVDMENPSDLIDYCIELLQRRTLRVKGKEVESGDAKCNKDDA